MFKNFISVYRNAINIFVVISVFIVFASLMTGILSVIMLEGRSRVIASGLESGNINNTIIIAENTQVESNKIQVTTDISATPITNETNEAAAAVDETSPIETAEAPIITPIATEVPVVSETDENIEVIVSDNEDAGAAVITEAQAKVDEPVKNEVPAKTETAAAASQPAASEPAASQPAASQPAASQPAASQPAASQPAASQQPAATTQPAASQPAAGEQTVTAPAPAVTDNKKQDPAASSGTVTVSGTGTSSQTKPLPGT